MVCATLANDCQVIYWRKVGITSSPHGPYAHYSNIRTWYDWKEDIGPIFLQDIIRLIIKNIIYFLKYFLRSISYMAYLKLQNLINILIHYTHIQFIITKFKNFLYLLKFHTKSNNDKQIKIPPFLTITFFFLIYLLFRLNALFHYLTIKYFLKSW